MDFFARQAAARSQTRALVVGFVLSLLAVAVALDVVLFTFLSSSAGVRSAGGPLVFASENPGTASFCTLLIMGILGLASLYKSMELRGGGGVVARDLGGVLVSADTTDPRRKRLLNVVAEMAIASGVPMPEVYVLEQEPAINAFAAGHTPANAAITVTQGALDKLNREQLQGVIGHEFSHVLNGDMRLNVQLMGWVFGLFIIGLIGRLIVNYAPRSRRSNNGVVALGFAVMVLGYVGLFLGRLLQAAVSRQRERLADASGVQFTRNPQGLKQALIKIAVTPEGSQLLTTHAEQAAHMFFAQGLDRFFATHPPILERIRELDPQFDPRELERAAAEQPESATSIEQTIRAQVPPPSTQRPLTGLAPAVQMASAGREALGIAAASAPGIGAAPPAAASAAPLTSGTSLHLDRAQAIELALPDTWREFQSPGRAQAAVLALLLSREPGIRERQLSLLSSRLGPHNFGIVQQAIPATDALDPMLRLPALQQLFPSLRRAPPAQRQALLQLVGPLIHADARIDVFEFCLAQLLTTLLRDEMDARAPHGTLTLEDTTQEIFVLFATFAQLGAADERNARMAYEAGMSGVLPMRRPEYRPIADWPRALSTALGRLDQLQPFAKQAVIDGLVKTIANDAIMTEAESELLRTVCALLHCPLPPLLGGPPGA